MIKSWINEVNTTSFRIIVSVVLAAIGVVGVLIALLLNNWLPTPEQMRVLEGVSIVVLTMMGFDVLQFVGKRFSDATYVAAKNSTPTPPDPPLADLPVPDPSPIPPIKLAGE